MTASDRVPAEDIVQLLAKAPAPLGLARRCALCNADLTQPGRRVEVHYADCPWRLAREWVDGG